MRPPGLFTIDRGSAFGAFGAASGTVFSTAFDTAPPAGLCAVSFALISLLSATTALVLAASATLYTFAATDRSLGKVLMHSADCLICLGMGDAHGRHYQPTPGPLPLVAHS